MHKIVAGSVNKCENQNDFDKFNSDIMIPFFTSIGSLYDCQL